MSKIKVLHLVKTAVGAKWAFNQTRELVKLGVEVHIALPFDRVVHKYQENGVIIHELIPAVSLLQPFITFQRARRLRRLVEQIKPDIIHSHFVTSTLLMRLALSSYKIPRIFHVPGPLHLEHPVFRKLELASAGNQDYWLASCKWTRECYLDNGIDSNKVGLAYYGVTPYEFISPEDSKTSLKEQLSMQRSDLLIGMVAYFYSPKRYLGQKRGLKGHEDLIDALILIREKIPNTRCVFVGGPWDKADDYFDKVKEYAREKVGDAAVFLGTRQDVGWLYPQFDLAVHPSHSENVGGAVESLFAKVPTIASNVGGFPDLIVDGETGYLCSPKNPSSIAKQVIRAWNEPAQRKKQAEAGFRRVNELMNVENNARDVLEFYKKILRENIKIKQTSSNKEM
ncbi:glycosyltransferase family 4 protein [Aliiglaciecola sp. CAU 1673]|uniref:glycosyltransferase family 4 protein n=1 Tax=Aliiglaciecola sp. CAU 1673 TaxID=3032595 RepID=UPI0023DC2830|nr:glycosyltransferase family 4 protein [Aliiglaciecola sp. CAU 1673]MDF2179791.1 glycosyltransferase family 4 protein [Aliiglaciecola sp. CAU 1673]